MDLLLWGMDELIDETDEEGVSADLARAAASKAFPTAIAFKELRAVAEPFLDRLVAKPRSSLSDSDVAALLTNSACSNWTTT